MKREVEHGCAIARINLAKCEMQRQSDLQAEKREVKIFVRIIRVGYLI